MSNTPGAQAQASKHAGQKQTFRHRRVAVAFFLFIGVPVYLGIHKKVASALDARALLIRKELEEARRLREEAEKVLADYQRKLGDVVMEVDNITALAAKQAETLAAETRQSLKEYDRCPNHFCAAPGPATVAITLLISVNLYVSLFLSLSLSLYSRFRPFTALLARRLRLGSFWPRSASPRPRTFGSAALPPLSELLFAGLLHLGFLLTKVGF